METLVYTSEIAQQDKFSMTECSICMEEFMINTTILRIPMCQHFFHPECIEKWFQSKYKNNSEQLKCPLCNTPVTLEELLRCKKEREMAIELQIKALNELEFIHDDDGKQPDNLSVKSEEQKSAEGDPDKQM